METLYEFEGTIFVIKILTRKISHWKTKKKTKKKTFKTIKLMENMPSEVASHLFTFCFVHKSATLPLN